MEIEIPVQLYEMFLIEAAKTESTVEEIVEFVFKNFMERTENSADE